MKVISLYGSPGSAKSTTAAGLFFLMKTQGINCELVTEKAKDLVWNESYKTLENQLLVFAEQYHRLWRLKGKVQYAVTDAPLLNSHVYAKNPSASFTNLINECYGEFENYNFFIKRVKPYNPIGRNQTEEQSNQLVDPILTVLKNHRYIEVLGDKDAPKTIWNYVLDGK
jgi:hypothetical protein